MRPCGPEVFSSSIGSDSDTNLVATMLKLALGVFLLRIKFFRPGPLVAEAYKPAMSPKENTL